MSTFIAKAGSVSRADLDLVPMIYIDPQDFGWVNGLGTSQDTALNAALAAAASLGGGRVLLPRGKTWINGPLLIPALVLLEGMGLGTQLWIQDGAGGSAQAVQFQAAGAGLRSLVLYGNKSTAIGGHCAGITWLGSAGIQDTILDNVIVDSFTGPGLIIDTDRMIMRAVQSRNNGQEGFQFNVTTGFVGVGLVAEGNGLDGFYITGSTVSTDPGCDGITLVAPVAKSNLQNGIRIAGRNTKNIEIISPRSKLNSTSGILFDKTDEQSIIGGEVTLNQGEGLRFVASRWNNLVGTKLKDNSQAGNSSANEVELADDGTIFSHDNTFNGMKIRITGTIKAGTSYHENTASNGPNYITGGSMDVGVTLAAFSQHPGTKFTGVAGVRDTEDSQTNVSTDYTVLTTDSYIRVTTGATDKTITLPDPTGLIGTAARLSLIVLKVDSGAGHVKIVSVNGRTINGLAEYDLTSQYQSVLLVSNNATWDAM